MQREHLARVGLVVIPAQVEHSVHHRLGQVVGVLGADHHVAELARPRRGAALVDREGQDVGGRVDAAMLAIQLVDAAGRDELDRQVAVLDPGRLERRQRRAPQLVGNVDEVDLDQGG